MVAERTTEGWEIRLSPRGAGRFFMAAFLGVWLCGWAFGEAFTLWFLVKGVKALLTGMPPDPGRSPLELGPALAVGAFLLVWLALWTFGGIAAIGEFLRLLWSQDRLIAQSAGLTIIRTRGPFQWRRELARERIRDVRLLRHGTSLRAEVERSYVELSRLGTRDERVEAAQTLRKELGLGEPEALAAGSLPEGWEEAITPEGDRTVIQDPSVRRRQAGVVGLFALVAATLTILLVREAPAKPALVPMALIAAVVTLALGLGTRWLARGRMEWRIGNGRLTLRKRFGSTPREVFEARRLELNVTTDSDGDEWFALDALSDEAPAAPAGTNPPSSEQIHTRPLTASVTWTWTWRSGAPGTGSVAFSSNRRRIVATMNEALVPRRLGAWLSSRADIPLDDRSTEPSRTVDLKALRDQLEAAGPVGRVVSRLIDRAEERRTGNG